MWSPQSTDPSFLPAVESESQTEANEMINEQTLLRQRNAIAEFSELALRSSCLETVLDEACRLISQALEAPRAKYLEYHPDQGTFWVRSGIGWDNGL